MWGPSKDGPHTALTCKTTAALLPVTTSGSRFKKRPGFRLLLPVPLRGPLPENSPDSDVRVRRLRFFASTALPKAYEWLVSFWKKNLSQTTFSGPGRTGLVSGRKKSTDPDDGNCRTAVQPCWMECSVREQFAFRNIPPTRSLGIPASLPRRTALTASWVLE